MSRLERALEYVAPIYAARRAHARLRLQAVEAARSYYDGADTGRRGGSIRRSNSSADVVTGRKLPGLRAGARDLVRNNPHAKRGVEAIVSNVVGAGIIPRFKRGKQAVPRLEKLARQTLDTTAIDVADRHDYYGLTALLFWTVVEAGEALVVRRWTGDGFPVQFQVLEPDHLDSSKDGILSNGGRIIQGVEFDSSGKRVRYWLYAEHPGGTFMRNLRSESFEARDVAHVYRVERPGQVRGIPWLSPVMLRIADFDDYENAQLVRQKIAACFSVFYTDSMGTDPPDSTVTEKVEPGIIQRLGQGAEVKFAQPPQVTDYKDYARVSLRAIAAGLGVSYEALTGDLEGANFSSGRMGWLEFQRNIDRWRWLTLIPQGCDVMMRWWLEGAALAGARTEGVTAQHTPPRREMISPEREVPALERAVASGQRTLSQLIQESGRDVDEHFDEMAEERRMLEERGVQLSIFQSKEPAGVQPDDVNDGAFDDD